MEFAQTVNIAATGIGLAIAYAALPGAVNAEALRRGVDRPLSALLVELGSVVGDSVWAAIGLSGAAVILASRPLSLLLALIGGAFMVRLAWRALVESDGAASIKNDQGRGDFATGLVFGLANPVGIGFWSGAAGVATLGSSIGGIVVFGVAFMAGAAAWAFGLMLALILGQRYLGPRILTWAGRLSALVLGGFGIRLLDQAAQLAITEAG